MPLVKIGYRWVDPDRIVAASKTNELPLRGGNEPEPGKKTPTITFCFAGGHSVMFQGADLDAARKLLEKLQTDDLTPPVSGPQGGP